MKKRSFAELNSVELATYKRQKKYPVVLVLENIRSMYNVGSVFRTADAFAVRQILLVGITAKPPHREINKTALGATAAVSWIYFQTTQQAITYLSQGSYEIAAVEQAIGSTLLSAITFIAKKPLALVFGNEVFGVSDDIMEACAFAIEIPQFGTKHSFNISVSVGIVLWEYVKQVGHDK